MAQLIIAQNNGVQTVTYSLPNKHYVPVDMRYIGIENIKSSVVSAYLISISHIFFPRIFDVMHG
jgi:urate oxidase